MTKKKIIWAFIVVAAVMVVGLFLSRRTQRLRNLASAQTVPIVGAVIQRDADPNRELPIAGVRITASSDGAKTANALSDDAGYFNFTFKKTVLSDRPVTVSFRHQGYEPLDLNVETGRLAVPKKLYIAAMVPLPQKSETKSAEPGVVVANIRVRYTINDRNDTNVGSKATTFEVINQANVPCNRAPLCSPDRAWKASSNSVSLDAGQDNFFSNIRASCIAGPCPFTRIDSNGFIHGGRYIKVSALNWSDTATFLLEAEVYHTAINAEVRELYPVIFGRTVNFTLPPTQEGVSLEADLNGTPMVFPLGPEPSLSWATCSVRMGMEEEKTTVYRCELKPGYRF
jgi:hypothetical protein